LNFLDRFLKILQILNFTKIRSVEIEMLHADGWKDRQIDRQAGKQGDRPTEGLTDMTMLKVPFRNFVKEPKTTPLAASIEAQSF
jgi:hypothetical protein